MVHDLEVAVGLLYENTCVKIRTSDAVCSLRTSLGITSSRNLQIQR